MSTSVTITDEEKIDVSYDFSTAKDAAGNTAPLDPASVITVDVDDAEIVSAEVNGNVVTVISENAIDASSVGQAQVAVVITDPNGTVVTDVIAVTVTTSAPVAISGSAGAAQPR